MALLIGYELVELAIRVGWRSSSWVVGTLWNWRKPPPPVPATTEDVARLERAIADLKTVVLELQQHGQTSSG